MYDPNVEDVIELNESGVPTGKKYRLVDVYNRHSGKVLCVVVVALILFFSLVFIYWGRFDRFGDRTDRRIGDLDHRLSSRGRVGGESFAANGLYAMSSIFTAREEYTLALCQLSLYRTGTGPGKREILLPRDTAQQVRALVNREAVPEKSFVIKTHFELHYNVNPSELVGVKLKGMSREERFLVLHYEVASNYAHFSTIKLVVSTEDIYRRIPRLKREVILCSDRPGSARRCSRRSTMDSFMMMNNSLLLSMEAGTPISRNPKEKNSSVKSETAPAGDGEDNSAEEGLNLLSTDKESLFALEQDIASIRLFHILFYKESVGEGGREAEDYSEYIALTVEPSACS
jgi:hypothetical protein